MPRAKLVHFSDLLCIWAHVGQANLTRLAQDFRDEVEIEVHYCSVFPDTQAKITRAWATRGGFDGYADHVASVAARFPGLGLHPDAWRKARPRSSASPHLFLKAVDLIEPPAQPFATRASTRAAAELRQAFFARAEDIATWQVQRRVAEALGLDFSAILQRIETGEAIAALSADYELAQAMGIQGSPTYVLNEGRQKLFGDIGYKVLSANLRALVEEDRGEGASFCA